MNGIDKALGRVVALIALLFFVAVALHGYLPGSDHPNPAKPASSAASLVGVDTLFIVSVVIVAIGFLSSLRRPRTPAHRRLSRCRARSRASSVGSRYAACC